jgi:hypothetical protein
MLYGKHTTSEHFTLADWFKYRTRSVKGLKSSSVRFASFWTS